MKKKKLLRTLKVLKTWARCDLEDDTTIALTPENVIKLIDRVLKVKK